MWCINLKTVTILILACILAPSLWANAPSEPKLLSTESTQLTQLIQRCLGDLKTGGRKDQERALATLFEVRNRRLLVHILTSKDTAEVSQQYVVRRSGNEGVTIEDLPWVLDAMMIWAMRIENEREPGDSNKSMASAGRMAEVAAKVLGLPAEDPKFEPTRDGFLKYADRLLQRAAKKFEKAENVESKLLCEWNAARLDRIFGDIEPETDPEKE